VLAFDRVIFPIIGQSSNPAGYLAIDSTINGYCCGGVRITPRISAIEVAELAHLMTLKYGFLGLPIGGAKAGIIGDPEATSEQKGELLETFGRALEPYLKRWRYVPWSDMGTTGEDIARLLRAAGVEMPPTVNTGRSSIFTGLTVAVAAAEAARYRRMDLASLTLAIEGFGKVGTAAALEYRSMGVRLVAISTSKGAVYKQDGFDIDQLLSLYKSVGSNVVEALREGDRIDKAKLLELNVDILSPCAGPYSITAENAARVSAKIVSPGANLPLDLEAERILLEKGIMYVPDFVSNVGGVLGATMESSGLEDDFIRQFITTRFARSVSEAIEASHHEGVPLSDYARRVAMQRFSQVKRRGERSRAWLGILALGPYLYGKGLIPRSPVRFVSQRFYEKAVLQTHG
jgi:glutamate dehydrogenase (NAD(P)+)